LNWLYRPVQHSEFSMFVALILSKIRAYRRASETIREQTQFTDHGLEDLGISRCEIDLAAHQNAVSPTASWTHRPHDARRTADENLPQKP